MRFLFALLLLAGCTTINHSYKDPLWPDNMLVVEHVVSQEEMRTVCTKYVSMPLACAEWNFVTRECHIWLDKDYMPDWVVEHERLHCQGYTKHE